MSDVEGIVPMQIDNDMNRLNNLVLYTKFDQI